MYGKHFYGMGGPTYDNPVYNPYMVVEAHQTLDHALRSPTCTVERSFEPLRGTHKLLM